MITRSKRSILLSAFLVLSISILEFGPSKSIAGEGPPVDTTTDLQYAVLKMNSWLHGSDQAEGWRRYLQLNVLDTQAALGDQADIATLSKLHQRFSFNTQGLSHPAFADVRKALYAQVIHLGSAQNLDPIDALNRARSGYRQISIADLNHQRNSVVYKLQVLVKYYRAQSLSSRDRAELFSDLQIFDTIEFLEGLEFQLPPEFSVGKTDSMIRDVRKQLETVIEKIDAIPSTPGPDEDESEDDESEKQDDDSALQLGPTPDDGKATGDDLEAEKTKLEAQIKVLTDQRKSYREKDRPRQTERRRVFEALSGFEDNFAEYVNTESNPYFISAVVAFEEFSLTYVRGTSDNLQEQYLRKLEDLSQQIDRLYSGSQREAVGEVGSILGWLENANQASELVTAIRSRFSLPNAYFTLSSRMINEIAGQSISQTRDLNEPIDGRQVRGSAQLDGQVSIELQDDPNQVHASIRFFGTLRSNTTLRERNIRAYAGANGNLEARRSVYANIGGLFANDTYAAAAIDAFFHGTSSKLRLVNKIAAKKFAQQKSHSEGYAARTAEKELLEQIAEQSDEQLANGIDALEKAQALAFAKSNLLPQIFLQSSRDRIWAIGKKSSMATLAAQNEPDFDFPTDVSISLHDSFLNNYLEEIFSNKTFTNKELEEEISSFLGTTDSLAGDKEKEDEEDDENDDKAADQPFSITFAQVRPIEFQFEDNRFSVVVSGRRFAQEGRRINEGLRIIMRFKIKRLQGSLKFVKDGKAEVEFLDNKKKTPRTVAFQSFLETQLNPKKGGQDISVDLSNNLIPTDQIKELQNAENLKNLQLVLCSTENGWLKLGWYLQPNGAFYQSTPMSLPAIWTETVITGMDPSYLSQSIEGDVAVPQGSEVLNLNAPTENE